MHGGPGPARLMGPRGEEYQPLRGGRRSLSYQRFRQYTVKPMTARRTRNSYEKLAPKTRTRNLHEIEHALFDARNSCEKYLAASRYDTHTSFSRELTRTSFSYEFLVRVSWALGPNQSYTCQIAKCHGNRA